MPKEKEPKYIIDKTTGCWIWQLGVSSNGYGIIWDRERGKHVQAHIFYYRKKYGPVPVGKQLDHIKCNTRICCNPDHVIPATPLENTRRAANHFANKTHCPRGHPYSEQNTGITISSRGYKLRYCKICKGIQAVGRIDK